MELGVDGFFFAEAAAFVGLKEATFGYHVWTLKTILPAERIGNRPVFARGALEVFKRSYKPYRHPTLYAAGQRLYSASQAAARIGVTRQRFSQWVKAGRIAPDTTINGRGRYAEATVDALLAEVYAGRGR